MDNSVIQVYAQNNEIQKKVRDALQAHNEQSDATKIEASERYLIRNVIGAEIVDNLLEENALLEDKNELLEERINHLEQKYGEVNKEYISTLNQNLVLRDSKSKRKHQKLLKIAQKMIEGQSHM